MAIFKSMLLPLILGVTYFATGVAMEAYFNITSLPAYAFMGYCFGLFTSQLASYFDKSQEVE